MADLQHKLSSDNAVSLHTNEELYYSQVALLNTLLEHRVISQAQYDKSFHDLTVKMGFDDRQKDLSRNL